MNFDLQQRTASLSVGEFAGFSLGPQDSVGGGGGVWRAQLGTHWHNELRTRAIAEHASAAEFEIPITGQIVHRRWVFTLTGRIDQIIRHPRGITLREIKSVARPLPADETALRQDYPEYFVQLATYAALRRQGLLASDADHPDVVRDLASAASVAAELVFVEVDSGLAQTIPLTPADDALFAAQLARVTEFLDLRLRARERLQHLRFRPAFATPRPGQETTRAELTRVFEQRPLVFFEAPTGFGKTGVLLEFALGQLKSGHFDRVLYLTSKATGQLQVVRTLASMTAPAPAETSASTAAPASTANPSVDCHLLNDKPRGNRPDDCHLLNDNPLGGRPENCHLIDDNGPGRRGGAAQEAGAAGTAAEVGADTASPAAAAGAPVAVGTPVAVWHVRNKAEHCVNTTFHCVRDRCIYLADAASRWAQSGLARFYLDERHARDLDTLRAAGRDARICPYEITRAALAFNDVWIGDYNYVFAPRNRGLFFEQPGFVAARTLLLIDEAHNLPSRVADAYSHGFNAADAFAVRDELNRVRPPAPLLTAWDHWCHFLQQLRPCDALTLADEDDARDLLRQLARLVTTMPVDWAALGPDAAERLWQVPALVDDLAAATLPRLWWCPRDGELTLTCLDAAPAIGATLREFGGVVLASATLTPVDGFAAACGLAAPPEPAAAPVAAPDRLGRLTKRDTRKLFRQLTSAAEMLRVEEAREAASPALLRAETPWRDGAYDIGFDARVDTTFQHRSRHYTATAATIVQLQAAAASATAVFFPSYAYAESIRQELASLAPTLRVAVQPKVRDLARQAAWVDESLIAAEVLFLVLGSSFAESIDALGGCVSHAMVVGPALPEVNAVQRARHAEAIQAGLSREEAFRRVYQVPGMTKVNQALGRLVRAPGQRARVLLHCRRFLEPAYTALLAPEYQAGARIESDEELKAWLRPKC